MNGCDNCGPNCTGLCQLDVRHVVFFFNSCGMICRSVAGTKVKEKVRMDDVRMLDWFSRATSEDISTRNKGAGRRALLKEENDWPTCAFVLDEDYVAWCVGAECTVDREASDKEVALFICAATRSMKTNDEENNEGDDDDEDEE